MSGISFTDHCDRSLTLARNDDGSVLVIVALKASRKPFSSLRAIAILTPLDAKILGKVIVSGDRHVVGQKVMAYVKAESHGREDRCITVFDEDWDVSVVLTPEDANAAAAFLRGGSEDTKECAMDSVGIDWGDPSGDQSVRIWHYEAGNQESKRAVEEAAAKMAANDPPGVTTVVIPRERCVPEDAFKQGDVVVLKTGSPPMVIEGFVGPKARCIRWDHTDGGSVFRDDIDPACLKRKG